MIITFILLLSIIMLWRFCWRWENNNNQDKYENIEIKKSQSRYSEIKEIENVCKRDLWDHYLNLYKPRVYQMWHKVVISWWMGPIYWDYFTSDDIIDQKNVLPLLKAIKKLTHEAYNNGRKDMLNEIEENKPKPKNIKKPVKKKVVNK